MSNNVKVVEIGLDDIEVGLRMPDLTAVQGLAASIEAHGLMSPIEVAKIRREGLNTLPSDATYKLECGGIDMRRSQMSHSLPLGLGRCHFFEFTSRSMATSVARQCMCNIPERGAWSRPAASSAYHSRPPALSGARRLTAPCQPIALPASL